MRGRRPLGRLRTWLGVAVLGLAPLAPGQPVAARAPEGAVRAFLELRGASGRRLASGELVQTVDGGLVTLRTSFRFDDASLHDETATFRQEGVLRLESYRLLRSGPRFGERLEASIDRASARHSWVQQLEGQPPRSGAGALQLPDDVYNGMLFPAVKGLVGGDGPAQIALVVFQPEPEVVRFDVRREPGEPLRLAAEALPSLRVVLRPALGWPLQLLASLAGRPLPELAFWWIPGEVPVFVRFIGPLHVGGPPWRILPVNPVWGALATGR